MFPIELQMKLKSFKLEVQQQIVSFPQTLQVDLITMNVTWKNRGTITRKFYLQLNPIDWMRRKKFICSDCISLFQRGKNTLKYTPSIITVWQEMRNFLWFWNNCFGSLRLCYYRDKYCAVNIPKLMVCDHLIFKDCYRNICERNRSLNCWKMKESHYCEF